MSIAQDANDTDAKNARSELRGKLIDAIETVATIVKNPDQLDKTIGVLGSVVAVPDEVTDDKKVGREGRLAKFCTFHFTLLHREACLYVT